MSISIRVGNNNFEIGTASFLNSFFSTIFVRLEQEKWGSRFPIVMNDLYSGCVDHKKAAGALIEIQNIREGLDDFSPKHVIWDYERLEALPPWSDNISLGITSLANYFITSDGKDLFDMLERAFQEALRKQQDVRIT